MKDNIKEAAERKACITCVHGKAINFPGWGWDTVCDVRDDKDIRAGCESYELRPEIAEIGKEDGDGTVC